MQKHNSLFDESQAPGDDNELLNENETSENDNQPPLPETEQLKKQMESQFIYLFM